MTKELVPLALLLFTAVTLLPQEEQQIKVNSGEVVNGVVIVTAQKGQTSLDLRCNKDITDCRIPEPGEYLMVRLPKNRGLYDCVDVRVYRKTADSEAGQLVGEYCLAEK
jgi:hypothetical protein